MEEFRLLHLHWFTGQCHLYLEYRGKSVVAHRIEQLIETNLKWREFRPVATMRHSVMGKTTKAQLGSRILNIAGQVGDRR
jgi:hypothetical protein